MFIYRHSAFNDSVISKKSLLVFFALKCVACFFYVWIFAIDVNKNLFNSDTQAIMHDASIVYQAFWSNPVDYLKILFGWYSETQNDYLYKNYFHLMENWDLVGTNSFQLNDSRGIVRINSFLMLFSFGKYETQALIMLFLSYVGEWLMYRAFKPYFKNKEFLLLLIMMFIPSVYFWTAGVLKEAIVLFLLGCFLYGYFQLFIHKNKQQKYIIVIIISSVLFFFIKPYVLAIIIFPLLIFTFLNSRNYKRIGLIYFLSLAIFISSGILFSKHILKKDIVSTIVKRQNDFVSVSYGGLFFYNYNRYLRFEYNETNMVTLKDAKLNAYSIKPHARYMYWKCPNFNDTLYVTDNADTVSQYPLINSTAPSHSAITLERLKDSYVSIVRMIPKAFINVLFKPLFFSIKTQNELLASIENLLIILVFISSLVLADYKNINWNFFFFLFFIVIISFVLIGLTTTLSGAIVRYKTPFLPFLLMIALVLLQEKKCKSIVFNL